MTRWNKRKSNNWRRDLKTNKRSIKKRSRRLKKYGVKKQKDWNRSCKNKLQKPINYAAINRKCSNKSYISNNCKKSCRKPTSISRLYNKPVKLWNKKYKPSTSCNQACWSLSQNNSRWKKKCRKSRWSSRSSLRSKWWCAIIRIFWTSISWSCLRKLRTQMSWRNCWSKRREFKCRSSLSNWFPWFKNST